MYRLCLFNNLVQRLLVNPSSLRHRKKVTDSKGDGLSNTFLMLSIKAVSPKSDGCQMVTDYQVTD